MFNSFIRLTHAVVSAAARFVQKWTKEGVQDATSLKHDFGDGNGPVKAIPYDEVGMVNGLSAVELKQTMSDVAEQVGLVNELESVVLKQTMSDVTEQVGLVNELNSVVLKQTMSDVTEQVGLVNELESVVLKQTMSDVTEQVGLVNGLSSVELDPISVFVDIVNNATDKIASINGTTGLILSNTDYTYSIEFVEGYEYTEGDLTVINGTLSEDGKTITIHATENLVVTVE